MNMDYSQLITPIASFLLGITVVSAFLAKFAKQAKKYVRIVKEALDLLDSVILAIDIKEGEKTATITAEEVKVIMSEIQQLRDAISAK